VSNTPSTMRTIPKMMLLTSLLAVTIENSARAADITFLCALALQPAMKELIPEFQATSGHNVKVSYATIGRNTDRVRTGEASDLAIVSPEQWENLHKEGKLHPAVRVVIAKSVFGIFVKKGAAKPDIVGSSEGVKAALLNARSIAVPDPTSGSPVGPYAVRLFERLGISAEVKPKVLNGSPLQLVAKGEAEIGLSQISEILAVPDLELIGPAPAEIQNYTTFMAAAPANANEAGPAKALIEFLRSVRGVTILKSKGYEPG
jgi:molybdate transport system substrate-binding protein